MSDLERARYRRDGETPTRRRIAVHGTQAQLGTIYDDGALPTSANKFFLLHPATILGTEAEGGSATITTDTGSSFAAYFFGNQSPHAGDHHVAKFADYRWIAKARRGCAADVNHFCHCGCMEPFPKKFYTGDGLGTHELTLNTQGPTFANWTGSAIAPGLHTFQAAGGTQLCSVETVLDLIVTYSLTHNCPSIDFPTGRWVLAVNWPVRVCTECFPNCPPVQRYGDPAHGGLYMNVPPQDEITGECDFSLLNFNIPAAATFGGVPLAGTANPGGGGTMAVAP